MMETLKQKIGSGKHVVFMYDIACTLFSYIKNQNLADHLLTDVTLAVPVCHNYGHQMACQILYNPRQLEAAGLADGEYLERLCSYFLRISDKTKSMSDAHRIHTLTAALLHYAKKALNKFL
jgi:hypothetical protein